MKIYKYISIILSCIFLTGCFSNKYVKRNQYLLDIHMVSAKNCKQHSCSIFIESMDSVSSFDQLDFLYRVGEDRYLIDYYNGFLTLPSRQLDLILRSYFKEHAKLSLEKAAEPISSQSLYTKLVELYADYRDHNNPKAVIAIQFILIDSVKNKKAVLLDKIFRSSVSLKAKTTDELLRAWNIGVEELLQNSSYDLVNMIKC